MIKSDHVDFNAKRIIRDKEGHFVKVKDSVTRKKYILNKATLKRINQKWTESKGEIDKSSTPVGGLIHLA